ncbi:aldehyde dehydrogenase [Pseudonocardia sulfidoxydans NBRC 16205]|uniref:Aldehyde dehydrogenase n=1 Tax=Pseudonocardia sulfidoxydans NBRC 16205 TaxID=1223511 RepID=A0A511DJS3_9PSEU|nr:aldehyde dehydrogenase family protein [Pseudonocardia sulfidoxydans]GEL25066.1 aldehyde dehydrogenase [Pseudonocardia sulfidoxydans NBRC 16205]
MPANTLEANEKRVAELLDRQWRLLVGGELVTSVGGRTFPVSSPYSGEVIAEVPDGTKDDANRAVEAAAAAFPAWAALSAGARADAVRALADAIEARGHDLALLDTVDGGAPVAVMSADVTMAVDALRYFAGLALESKGYTVPASTNLHYTELQPYGVVAKIIPFNHPIMFAASKIAAPLVAGNTVVLKPAEATPLSALLLGEICGEVLPAGVVNVVVGDGIEVPDTLVRHPDVYRIGFTGSEGAGRAIQRAAAESAVKTVTLELGGKNALIAFPDADLDEVARAAVQGMNFTWSGQSCGSTSRLLLHEDIADAVVERVVRLLQGRTYHAPLDPAAIQGTIVNRTQYDRVLGYVEAARAEGARVAVGGGRPEGVDEGLFIAPTVLDDVRPEHRVANEEIFGPVISVLRWREEDEAVALANSVRYGLTGSVFTNDIRRAHRVARALQTGFVWINAAGPHYAGVPYGGWKNSGTGKEEGIEELLSYSQVKSVNVNLAGGS